MGRAHHMDILVVDDEPSIRRLLRRLLEGEGHVVSEAEHGAAALTLVKGKHPDLVITDLMMPVMNGHELIATLRDDHTTASIPIVVVSSGFDLHSLRADAAVAKPFTLQQILSTVHAVITGDPT